MSKFRFYVTDLYDGDIKGTNDPESAKNFAQCEDFFVVDTETGTWLTAENEEREIKEVTL